MSTRSDPVISVRHVSKTFSLDGGRRRLIGRSENRTAVDDVTFDVWRGQGVAIVGRNGAGKSTLLRMVCGIMEPDSGSVAVNGRLSPVFGMQAGFQPELTGLENVRNKCALMGMDAGQIDQSLDDILRFAGIGEYAAQPLRTYSNGMRGRLAFAVTFASDPEILVVDETLAAGDMVFHKKCMDRIGEIRESGATVLIVSHGLAIVQRFCDRALLLERGRLVVDGPPADVNRAYTEISHAEDPLQASRRIIGSGTVEPTPAAPGDGGFLRNADADLVDLRLPGRTASAASSATAIEFVVVARKDVARLGVEVSVCDDDDAALFECRTDLRTAGRRHVGAGDRFAVRAELANVLEPGGYRLQIRVLGRLEERDVVLHQSVHDMTVDAGESVEPRAAGAGVSLRSAAIGGNGK